MRRWLWRHLLWRVCQHYDTTDTAVWRCHVDPAYVDDLGGGREYREFWSYCRRCGRLQVGVSIP